MGNQATVSKFSQFNASSHRMVVLTRPPGKSSELAHALAAYDIETFEFPLIQLSAVNDNTPLLSALASLRDHHRQHQHQYQYALVIFISPNAIDYALANMTTGWPTTVPIGVMGPGSVRALKRYGIAAPTYQVISPKNCTAAVRTQTQIQYLSQYLSSDQRPRYDSEALARALDDTLGLASLNARHVLMIRGDSGREWLADRLRAYGARLQTITVYRRKMPKPTAAQWARVRALLSEQCHAWLLTSSESVRNLEAMAQRHLNKQQIAALKQTLMLVPHMRIAESAKKLGFNRMAFVDIDISCESIIRAVSHS